MYLTYLATGIFEVTDGALQVITMDEMSLKKTCLSCCLLCLFKCLDIVSGQSQTDRQGESFMGIVTTAHCGRPQFWPSEFSPVLSKKP